MIVGHFRTTVSRRSNKRNAKNSACIKQDMLGTKKNLATHYIHTFQYLKIFNRRCRMFIIRGNYWGLPPEPGAFRKSKMTNKMI